MININEFSTIDLHLATDTNIRTWSNGEVKKPETVSYRTLKPETDGLFCEKIFGPIKNWECACGKYRRRRFKGIICERCGVEVTHSRVRRDRMGHIELVAPVVHIWYLRGTRSWITYLLSGLTTSEELQTKGLERVIYFESNMVTWVNKKQRNEDLEYLEADMKEELSEIETDYAMRLANKLEELEVALVENETLDETNTRKASAEAIIKLGEELENLGFTPTDKPAFIKEIHILQYTASLKTILSELNSMIALVVSEVEQSENNLIYQHIEQLDKDLGKLKFHPTSNPVIGTNLKTAYAASGLLAVLEAVSNQVLEIEMELNEVEKTGKKHPDSRSIKPFIKKLNVFAGDIKDIVTSSGRSYADALIACCQTIKNVQKEIKKSALDETKQANIATLRKDAKKYINQTNKDLITEKDLAQRTFDTFCTLHQRQIIDDEYLWSELITKYESYFEGGMGAEYIGKLIARLDFDKEEEEVIDALSGRGQVACIDVDLRNKDISELEGKLTTLKNQTCTKIAEQYTEAKDNLVTRRLSKLETSLGKLKYIPKGGMFIVNGFTTAYANNGIDGLRKAIEEKIIEIEAIPQNQSSSPAKKTKKRGVVPFVRQIYLARDEITNVFNEIDIQIDEEGNLAAELHDLTLKTLKTLEDNTVVENEGVAEILNMNYSNYVSVSPPRKPLSQQRKQKALKRLQILTALNRRDENGRLINDPRALVLNAIPVMPPDLRPMVQLDGGRFAISDLNDLYRRIVNRNNRLRKLFDLKAPEIIINNEKRMLQEAVDSLFDNGSRGNTVTGPGGRPLKSLSEILKGKQGRFRQNLLGKRVDYSGRSVIVVGPTLRLHQCGLPKLMALEIFKPFVMKGLIESKKAPSLVVAKRMVERHKPEVWGVLEEIIREHPVLLNRAPTLHRLGIQAFEPVLVEGKAIQIHPLVCAAFNADFDGDQMAVHLPLSPEAQAEARILMLSANNIISPADGRPVAIPSLDMIIGSYYMTLETSVDKVSIPRAFRHLYQIENAVSTGELKIHDSIEWRSEKLRSTSVELTSNNTVKKYELTTAGRVLFNNALPDSFPFVNTQVTKSKMGDIIRSIADKYPSNDVANTLDALKNLCFTYASRSGLTISMHDVTTPPDKTEILERHEQKTIKVEQQFKRGIITNNERRQKEVEIWTSATEEVHAAMEKHLASSENNPVNMMVHSGARGNLMQVRQITAIRGLVVNSRGDIIPRPIKSSYGEGLTALEYFISTPGARKGLVDTALRTADSGYLTRRLVDVAQELIINDEDPIDEQNKVVGIWLEDIRPDTPDRRSYLETRLFSRCLAADVTLSNGTILEAGSLIGDAEVVALRDDPQIDRVQVLSPLTDNSRKGISAKSYGASLATGRLIEVGEAVGVIAAQSIGEPGTQLTMRTFHTGGVIGTDIAAGLPRVVELFEARTPRSKALLAERAGTVRVGAMNGSGCTVQVQTSSDDTDSYIVPIMSRLEVSDGEEIKAGAPIMMGPSDPKELIRILGTRETQKYLITEVQKVYREQGVSIHDKHIELIVRQMTRNVLVSEAGDSEFRIGDQVNQHIYRDSNHKIITDNGSPAQARPIIMGITKASLVTDSWLSAASFQETTRVLTEAAIKSSSDNLSGLKENVIMGRLIPAGTGQMRYRQIETVNPNDDENIELWELGENKDTQDILQSDIISE